MYLKKQMYYTDHFAEQKLSIYVSYVSKTKTTHVDVNPG